MANELRTQGTEMWMLDIDATPDPVVLKISNATGFGDFGPMANDLPTTNLDSTAVEKLSGLPDNGDATININIDVNSEAHRRLRSLAGTDARRWFVIGYSDGVGAPTIDDLTDEIEFPTDRYSERFFGAIKSFRKTVQTDSILSATVAIGISGAIEESYAES